MTDSACVQSSTGMLFVIGMVIGACGCAKDQATDTAELFSELKWEQALAKEYPNQKPDVLDRRYRISRKTFLNAQVARALMLRNKQNYAASELTEAERNACLELLRLERDTNAQNDDSGRQLDESKFAIEKRRDGYVSLVIERGGTRYIRSTTATWSNGRSTNSTNN